jgi:DNA-binding protein Fis
MHIEMINLLNKRRPCPIVGQYFQTSGKIYRPLSGHPPNRVQRWRLEKVEYPLLAVLFNGLRDGKFSNQGISVHRSAASHCYK